MSEQKKLILTALAGIALFFAGAGLGWFGKPDPTVEIRAILKPPFVEVLVGGKVYDASHLKVMPQPKEEKKKGWWGTNDGKMHFGDVATRCECEDCPADCGCGCKKNAPVFLTTLLTADDKTFTSLASDPKFLSGIAAIIEKINAWLGYVDQNADGWKRDAARHAEWTATQVTWGLILLGGIFGALVVNGFLTYANLNALARR